MSQYIGRDVGGYRIMEAIGAGGMARVFKAYEARFDRFVALKVLPEHYAEDPTYLARFEQEAKIIARLEHAHILPVHDFGHDAGMTYLAMRYLRGGTLKDALIASGGRLSLRDAARLVGQIASALDYAHSQGIVHRDVKPANVMIDSQGNAHLTDFGIAKVLEATGHLTATGGAMGTPAYMSPEQGAGKKVDARTDVYSLGIMLYQMVTGRVPYEADTPFAIIIAHSNEPLPMPSQFNPDLPEEVERVIFKALAKNPDDRFRSAGELAAALNQIVESLGDTLESDPTDLLEIGSALAESRPTDEVTRDVRIAAKKRPRRAGAISPVWLGVGALVVIALIAALGWSISANIAASQATIDPAQYPTLAAIATQTGRAFATLTREAAGSLHNVQNATWAAQLKTDFAPVSPTPTVTSTPNIFAAAAGEFADPILAAIASRSSDFADDFSSNARGWQLNYWPESSTVGQSTIENGILNLESKGGQWAGSSTAIPIAGGTFQDFIMRIDVTLESNSAIIPIHVPGLNFILVNGGWQIEHCLESGCTRIDGHSFYAVKIGNPVQVMFVKRGNVFVPYLNEQPVFYVDNLDLSYYQMELAVQAYGTNNEPVSATFDNIQLWNLDNVPGIP